MLLIKNYKKIISIISIFCLMLTYSVVHIVEAASLENASDTLSDSDVSASATHTVTFTTNVTLASATNDYIEVTFPSDFGDVEVGNITCPSSSTASAPDTETARCTVTSDLAPAEYTISVASISNPSTVGSQTIDISTYTNSSIEETIDVMVSIIDDVTISATVSSSLTFAIAPLGAGVDVNGSTTTVASATTTLEFGTLTVNTPAIMGQELTVTTNADDGYTVTVEQDQNLTSNSGSDIDSFVDGTPGSPATWTSPGADLDSENTYGHMGITSEDSSINAADPFGDNLYQGFSGTTPIDVMYHDGPSDGSTDNKGLTQVAYQIEISALQEAGDYTNTLTYICTPTF